MFILFVIYFYSSLFIILSFLKKVEGLSLIAYVIFLNIALYLCLWICVSLLLNKIMFSDNSREHIFERPLNLKPNFKQVKVPLITPLEIKAFVWGEANNLLTILETSGHYSFNF